MRRLFLRVRVDGTEREEVYDPRDLVDPRDVNRIRRHRYDRLTVTTLAAAEEWARAILDAFNQGSGDTPRDFVSVRFEEESEIEKLWRKLEKKKRAVDKSLEGAVRAENRAIYLNERSTVLIEERDAIVAKLRDLGETVTGYDD